MLLSRMIYEEPIIWVHFISLSLRAYRTLKRTSTQVTIYVVEEVVPIKMVLSTRLTFASKLDDPHDRIYDVDALKKMRHSVENKWLFYKKKTSKLQ